MLNNIGNLLILSSIVVSILIIYCSIHSLQEEKKIINKKLFTLSLWQSTFTLTSFFALIIGFIVSDFSLITVFQNSHSLKPLFYKITATWGDHEGSLLLWINVLVIFSFLFLIFNKDAEKRYRIYTLITQNVLIIGFL